MILGAIDGFELQLLIRRQEVDDHWGFFTQEFHDCDT